MRKTRFCLSALLTGLLVVLVACVGEVERPTPTPTLTPFPPPSPTPTATPLVVEPTPTATPSPTVTPVVTPGPTPTPGVGVEIPTGLFLRITNLPKESVVRIPTVSISGTTTPDAVVSVNGVLVDVDGEGNFTSTVALEEAPNVIEVVASDFQGNKVSAVLTIIYIP